jgi:hypothetical protein
MQTDKYAHEMLVGESYAPLEFVVTPSMNEQLLFAVQDYHPRYWRQTAEGPPIVHPVLFLQMSPRTRSPSWRLAPNMGSVLGREHTEFCAPGYVGRQFRVAWTILDVYEKRGRPYHKTETVITDDQGRRILRRELHSTFFLRHGKNTKETS